MTGFALDVRVNTREFEAQLRALKSGLIDKAAARALNRTATTVRADAASVLSREIPGLRVGAIKRQLSIVKAKPGRLIAIVRASTQARSQNLPLSFFRPRQTRSGVTAKVGRQRITVPHAFVMPATAKRSGVYLRTLPNTVGRRGYGVLYTDAAGAYRQSRKQGRPVAGVDLDLPISQVMAPGIPAILAQSAIQFVLKRVANDRFKVVYAQELSFQKLKGA